MSDHCWLCAHCESVDVPSGVGQRCWLWWLISSDQVFWRLLSFYLPADSNLLCLSLAVRPLTSIKSHLFGMNPPCSGSFSVGPPELCELKLKCYVTAGVKVEQGVNDWLEVYCSSEKIHGPRAKYMPPRAGFTELSSAGGWVLEAMSHFAHLQEQDVLSAASGPAETT